MKVTVDGTVEEILNLVNLIQPSLYSVRVPENTDSTPRAGRTFQARDDVPDRDREEGVQ